MADQHDDLRATEESLRRDADRLSALEQKKTSLDPEDEQVPELSEQAERVASEARDKAVAERDLADRVQSDEE
jgi:hypothetical protein